jgi:lipopolysaccharide transport system ATP-binding protein
MLAVKADNLSKRYYLGSRHNSVRDAVAGIFRLGERRPQTSAELWALRDVTFDVKEGEVLGIVGNNGAGKSTLLKILSRITKPTSGAAEIRGRVGSLLEVGTGFHSELTGRENIFLNGAILGMKRREIERKFDEIVNFAEIERFIDTPVKHYSSGMFMRIAFSVAAHLEPDILIIDEVLAVGDVDFQHKCLDKMQAIMREGRTILFVSHNMSAVTRLCTRAVALGKGRVVEEGSPQQVVASYLNSGWGLTAEKIWETELPGNEIVRLKSVRIINESGETSGSIEMHRRVGIEAEYEVFASGHVLVPNFHVFSQERQQLFAVQDVATEWNDKSREKGIYKTRAWLPPNFFNEGRIIVEAAISSHVPETRVHLRTDEAVSFEVVENPDYNYTRGAFSGAMPGVVRPAAEWDTEMKSK